MPGLTCAHWRVQDEVAAELPPERNLRRRPAPRDEAAAEIVSKGEKKKAVKLKLQQARQEFVDRCAPPPPLPSLLNAACIWGVRAHHYW